MDFFFGDSFGRDFFNDRDFFGGRDPFRDFSRGFFGGMDSLGLGDFQMPSGFNMPECKPGDKHCKSHFSSQSYSYTNKDGKGHAKMSQNIDGK